MKKKIVISIIIGALLLSFAACGKKKNMDAKPTNKTLTFSESELLSNLDNSVGMWEYAQKLLSDVILYKTRFGTWAYVGVDKSLPANTYDWDNLRHAGPIAETQWEYYEGSELKSIKGIDLSEYNTVKNWSEIKKDGVQFVMLRAGYRGYSSGKLVTDKKFLEYAAGAHEQGIQVGVYFVTQAISEAEAIEEADYVLALMKEAGVPFTYPIALDLEDTASNEPRTLTLGKASRTAIIKAFCERIKEAGYEPMLYSAIRWYVDEMDLKELTEYKKWFAQYFNQPYFPYEFQMWQYTSSGNVEGISGNVDLNICMEDFAAKK